MQPLMCTRCKKNVAIVFITKIENGVTSNEGMCLKCAREMGIQPMNDIMKRLGITDEELESLSGDMMDVMLNDHELAVMGTDNGDSPEEEDEDGKTATFPFLGRLFNNMQETPENGKQQRETERRDFNTTKRKFLENYCISLSKKAREGKLDRIVGREHEIERVMQILNRRQKNNPCLIGEPGVGKTAIAEGLAQCIADGIAPIKLSTKEVYLLDLTSLVAGTQFRGQFESRMKGLIEEIRKLGNIILVIDEVHTLVGAGDAEGSMNAANILKPALSRGEIQVIGATTFAEYRKHIEKDAALERRFQPITVSEPSIEEAVDIIIGIARYYEQFHGVIITPEVARQAVLLSERYITDRFLPDKAIDLIDEACSDLNLKNPVIREIEAINLSLNTIQIEREKLMNNQNAETYERLAFLLSKEMSHTARKNELMKGGAPLLSIENLAHIIEQWTKIPAANIREQEFERLYKLEDRLTSHIVGQDEAVSACARAIRRRRVGLSSKLKPVSFIFTGPTGVGKTELVKRLAQDLFNTPDSLIRLDMSEFMEKHAVSRIIGAPPGYVGYDEAGQLTEKVRRKPYCVILFDEIEKAHPDVLNILLQVLDDGQVTDAHGRKVNFENTIIIMTSNAGSDKNSSPVGFSKSFSEQSSEKALKALKDFMRPEFINRVDEIIAFKQLTEADFAKICKIMLDNFAKSLSSRGYELIYDRHLIDYLVKKSYSIKYGARSLNRFIQKEVEDAIALLLIENYNKNISSLNVIVDKDKLHILPNVVNLKTKKL